MLWTSFEYHLPLSSVLNTVGDTFADELEANGIHWQALTDLGQRREAVIQVLAKLPVLWVWDNVEPVTGFSAGTRSVWNQQEQDELIEFLRDLANRTRCKVVLTSRRDERDWLGDLASRVQLPPMPMRESLQLTAAIIARRAADTPRDLDWRPLLRYTAGNPLTITVVVGLALRERLATSEEIEGFVARVRAGEVALEGEGDADLGRSRSLAASLDYGFTHAFTDTERSQLAVLHLFRDMVDVRFLHLMGNTKVVGADVVPALAGLSPDAGISLLDRAVEIGLLTSHGAGHYGIHPALPWYLTTQFTLHHGIPGSPATEACARAYSRSISLLGHYYNTQAQAGHAAALIPSLAAEEANLLHALELARHHSLLGKAVGCLQGLRVLYERTGRTGEWARLVDQATPDYVDPASDGPLPGREADYSVIASYRVRLARQARDWPTASRLQKACTDWDRHQAQTSLAQPPDQLDNDGRNLIRNLAVSLQDLGRILMYQGDPACLPALREALDLSRRTGDRGSEAKSAGGIGDAYLEVGDLRDLDKAQHWHQISLDAKPEHDRLGRAISYTRLGSVAFERFRNAEVAGAPKTTLAEHLNSAAAAYGEALNLIPAGHPAHFGAIHYHLGMTYEAAGDQPTALSHYQQFITYEVARGDTYNAGIARYAVALLYANAGNPADAVPYAQAALDDFQTVGAGGAADVVKAKSLISRLRAGRRSNHHTDR